VARNCRNLGQVGDGWDCTIVPRARDERQGAQLARSPVPWRRFQFCQPRLHIIEQAAQSHSSYQPLAHPDGFSNYAIYRVAVVDDGGGVCPRWDGACQRNRLRKTTNPKAAPIIPKTRRLSRFTNPLPQKEAKQVRDYSPSNAVRIGHSRHAKAFCEIYFSPHAMRPTAL
jgi:hypothetical protein